MKKQETELLYRALCYEEGHPRRTQHILKVYALARMLGEREELPAEEREVLQAAAILHDIAIKYCKETYDGDASQEKQKKEAPGLVKRFLQEAGYPSSLLAPVLELVIRHHDYEEPKTRLLQLLMEADLIVNCYESRPDSSKIPQIRDIFQTPSGKELLELCLKG